MFCVAKEKIVERFSLTFTFPYNFCFSVRDIFLKPALCEKGTSENKGTRR